MPCKDYSNDESRDMQRADAYTKTLYQGKIDSAVARANNLAVMLCTALRELEMRSFSIGGLGPEVLAWWEEHKRQDLARLEKESRDAAARQARDEALAKLSPADRALLGVS